MSMKNLMWLGRKAVGSQWRIEATSRHSRDQQSSISNGTMGIWNNETIWKFENDYRMTT